MFALLDKPQQLDFPSLAFGPDRTVLYVGEVAVKWRVTEQHVIDLLEEGKLNGFDIAGKYDYVRVPTGAIAALARRFNTRPEVVLDIIQRCKPERNGGRSFWRVAVKEGFESFMRENHS